MAAAALKDRLREAAAKRFNCAPEEVTIAHGRVTAPDSRALTLADLAPQGLAAESSFLNHRHTYTYGTHIAHVAVDARLGHVQLVDYVAVEDVGRIINPLTLHGQVVGAIVQGLGGTLLEDLVYDREGQLLTATFADYLMPLATDFPQITAISLELRPSPSIPWARRAPAKAASFRWAGSSPMPSPRRSVPSTSSRTSCRSRRRWFGACWRMPAAPAKSFLPTLRVGRCPRSGRRGHGRQRLCDS